MRCVYPSCENSSRTRGLCHQHYQTMRSYVRAGKASEEDLERRGLLLEKGRGGSTVEGHDAFLRGSDVRGERPEEDLGSEAVWDGLKQVAGVLMESTLEQPPFLTEVPEPKYVVGDKGCGHRHIVTQRDEKLTHVLCGFSAPTSYWAVSTRDAEMCSGCEERRAEVCDD